MKHVRCINTTNIPIPTVKLGGEYYLDERSVHRENNGFEYTDIYEDRLGLHFVGTLRVDRFHDSIIKAKGKR